MTTSIKEFWIEEINYHIENLKLGNTSLPYEWQSYFENKTNQRIKIQATYFLDKMWENYHLGQPVKYFAKKKPDDYTDRRKQLYLSLIENELFEKEAERERERESRKGRTQFVPCPKGQREQKFFARK